MDCRHNLNVYLWIVVGGNMSAASVSGSSAPRQLMDMTSNRPSFPWNQQMPAPPIPPICPPWMQQQQSQQQTSVTSQMDAPNGRYNFSFGSLAPPPPPPPPPMSWWKKCQNKWKKLC